MSESHYINITTQPSGAKIFVNGKQKGLSPITLKKTLPGSYEIKATLKGYKEKLKQVLVAEAPLIANILP